MAAGDPQQGDELIISVSSTAAGTKTPVHGMTRVGRRKSRGVTRTTVFMRSTPYVARGMKEYGFTVSGLFIPDDAGQQLIRDAEAAGTSVFITILHNGTDGQMQECLVSSLSMDADPEAIDTYGFEFTGVDEPTAVGLGPIA